MVIHRGDMLSEEPPGIRICMRQPGHQRNAPAPVEDQLSWAGPSSFSCVHYGMRGQQTLPRTPACLVSLEGTGWGLYQQKPHTGTSRDHRAWKLPETRAHSGHAPGPQQTTHQEPRSITRAPGRHPCPRPPGAGLAYLPSLLSLPAFKSSPPLCTAHTPPTLPPAPVLSDTAGFLPVLSADIFSSVKPPL
uniref:Uncharacterized protein n=1 Tax=Rousettus aegyptiacus TaxID=9407 RepID=A0A7J8JGX0_ROUAE|nr:hypothetical protein HJG63_010373 [Rousettus aegyptiacus]